MDIETIKESIVKQLKPLGVERVILFGSYAYGKPHQESDIDLYVVTNDEFVPQSWREKNQIYLKVAKAIRELRKNVAIDLIVHTKQMHEAFKKSNSSFYKYDISQGITLL